MTTAQHEAVAEAVVSKYSNSIRNRVLARKGTDADQLAVAKLVAKKLAQK